MLSVVGLRKSFAPSQRRQAAHLALDGVDLTVPEKAFAAVLGPSGSGKTTLLRCIAGFEVPDEGTIVLGGRTLVSPTEPEVPSYRRGIGIVPQEGALFPHLTVARNITFGIADRSRAWRRERLVALLELVGMPGLGDRRPHELSGGQQQRVALARALAPEPGLILLDEPFSALDAQLRVELREEVRELLRRVGTTTILVTHDQSEALTLADHLVVMRAGRVVAAGDPREVYAEPVDAELGRFLGESVVLPGRIVQDGSGVWVDCVLGRLEAGPRHCPDGDCDVLVRPEQLTVRSAPVTSPEEPRVAAEDDTTPGAAPPMAAAVPRRGVPGVVSGQSFFGPDAVVRVRLRSAEQVAVRVAGYQQFRVGDEVEVRVHRPVTTFPRGSQPAG